MLFKCFMTLFNLVHTKRCHSALTRRMLGVLASLRSICGYTQCDHRDGQFMLGAPAPLGSHVVAACPDVSSGALSSLGWGSGVRRNEWPHAVLLGTSWVTTCKERMFPFLPHSFYKPRLTCCEIQGRMKPGIGVLYSQLKYRQPWSRGSTWTMPTWAVPS